MILVFCCLYLIFLISEKYWTCIKSYKDLVLLVVTGCKDIDDALHCTALSNGNFEVGVRILWILTRNHIIIWI